MIGGRVRGRRFAAGGVAVLVAGLGVVACSGSGGAAGSSASASPSVVVSGSASATAEASVSASAPGEVTAESLSDEELGYIVTSIPEGMDDVQAEAVRAYVAYDQFTWRLWFTPAGTGTGMEGADEVMTEARRQTIEGQYSSLESGRYLEGQVRTAILGVRVDYQVPMRAEIEVCSDRGDMKDYNGAGEDVTTSDVQGRFKYSVLLVYSGEFWRVDSEDQLSKDECVV